MKIFKPKTLCSEYWRTNYIRGKLNHPIESEVSQMRYLTFLNHKLLTGKNPHNINNFAKSFGYSFEENIKNADIEFKNIQKTKKDITVYRGIAKPDENKDVMYYKLFNKAQNLKENETIVMKEYAFAAFDKNIAQKHMKECGGILYEITVPKGARISQLPWEVAFPRYSKFKCMGNKEIKGKNNYNLIKLKYNLPIEDWNNFSTKLAQLFKKQK